VDHGLSIEHQRNIARVSNLLSFVSPTLPRIGGPWFLSNAHQRNIASKKHCTSEQVFFCCVADIAASTTEGVSIGRTRAEINGLVITSLVNGATVKML